MAAGVAAATAPLNGGAGDASHGPLLRPLVQLLADRSVNSVWFNPLWPAIPAQGGGGSMLYDAYEMQRSLLAGASTLANIGAGWMQNPVNPFSYSQMGPIVASALDVFAHAAAPRGKPEFGLERTRIEGRSVAVHEEVVLRKPFGQLK